MRKILMLIALVAVSCTPEDAAEAAINAAIKAEGGEGSVNLQGDKITVTTDEGTVTYDASGTTLPADFPGDVPLVGGYTVMGTLSTGEGHVVNLEYSKNIVDLQKEIKAGLLGKGWTLEAEMTYGDGGSLQFKKDDRNAFFMMAQEGDKTTASVTVAKDE